MIFLNPKDIPGDAESLRTLAALNNPLEFTVAVDAVWNHLPNLRGFFLYKHIFVEHVLFVCRLGKNGYVVFTKDREKTNKCYVDVYAPKHFLRPQKFIAICQMAVTLGRSHVEAWTSNPTMQRFLESAGFSKLRKIVSTGQVGYAANIRATEIETMITKAI